MSEVQAQEIELVKTAHLSADDEELHDMVRHVLRNRDAKKPARVWAMVKMPFKAIKFLIKRPSFWPFVMIPAAISMMLLAVLFYMVFGYTDGWFLWLWSKPTIEGWYDYPLAALWWLAYALIHFVVLIVLYVVSITLGGVLSSPFNDILSEKTEKALLGSRYQEAAALPFWSGLLKSLGSSTLIAFVHLMLMIPLLFLNFLPGIGSLLYTVASATLGSYFLAMEYTDTLLVRKGLSFGQKLSCVWRERTIATGFGLGVHFMLAIPIVNLFCIPVAVVAGTAVGLALDQWMREDEEARELGTQEVSVA